MYLCYYTSMRNKLLLLLVVGALLKVALIVSSAYKVSYALSHSPQTTSDVTRVAVTTQPKDNTSSQSVSEQPQQPDTSTSSTTSSTAPASKTPSSAANTPSGAMPQPVAASVYASLGNMASSYWSCGGDPLLYTIYGPNVSSSQPGITFSWRVELNDGQVIDSGTNTMPTGSTFWSSFPNSPDYPSPLVSLSNAEDGDAARFVVTSPNYSATGWTPVIPAGSEASCY
jgi:hypothetical protein